VPAEPTPATAGEVKAAIANAYKAIVGRDAPAAALTVLAAHSALETASWQSMDNNNLGFITRAPNDNFDWFVRGSNPLHFRAYATLDQGAADFVQYLSKRGAIEYADSGDVRGYVNRLSQIGYCGPPGAPGACDYAEYEAGVARLAQGLSGVQPAPEHGRGLGDGGGWGPAVAAATVAAIVFLHARSS
jgi:hypothetical protein